ncbi:MAG: lipocalin family protein [Clostridia bacterium]|nr:lipocalin family protein [Clostridia bacterium]
MKRFLICLLAVLTVLALIGCGSGKKESGEAAEILGEWNLTKAVVSGVEVTAEQIGQSMSFTFNADGSAAMTANGQTQQGLSWSYADGIVTLSALGRDLYDLTYDGTALTLHEPNSGADLVFER